ncbi:unnamed protein product, partial [Chrysoparadoxa australica]
TLSRPFAALPAFLANYSSSIMAPSSFDASGEAVAAIGTGPFKVESVEPPLKLSVVRHDGYWGDAPAIERAVYNASGRAETRALMAESGQADLVFTLDTSGVARLQEVDAVSVKSVAIPRVLTLKLNSGHPFLKEPEARQALSLAIDRQGIAQGILRSPDAAANQMFAPVLSAWHDPSLPVIARDLDKARSLLAGLGWSMGEGNVLVREGKPFRLALRTFPSRPELPLIAAALQSQWKEIGGELEVSVGNSSSIPGGHQDGTLELAL